MTRKRQLVVAGLGVAIAHHVVEWYAWALADSVPGQARTTPWLWLVTSFPGFPLYEWLTGGDRSMFRTFEWVMVANSVVWGAVAALVAARIAGRRVETTPKP